MPAIDTARAGERPVRDDVPGDTIDRRNHLLHITAKRALATLSSVALLLAGIAVLTAAPASAHIAPGDHPVTATPSTGLHDGDTVQVSGAAGSFAAGTQLFIAQCSSDPNILNDTDGSKSCRLDGPTFGFYSTTAAADGSFGPVSVPVHTGQLGTDPLSVCPPVNAGVPPCVMFVSNFDATHAGYADLDFASAPSITVSPDHARPGNSVSVSGSSFDPSLVNADFSVALCAAGGGGCSSSEISASSLSTDASGVLSGSVTLDVSATTGDRELEVTQTGGAHPGSASAPLHVLATRAIVLSPDTGGLGTPVSISGTEFDPGATLSVVGFDSTGTTPTSDTGTATVDSHGGVTGSITINDAATAWVAVAEDDNPLTEFAAAPFSLSANSCTGSGCEISQTVVQQVNGTVLSQSQAASVINMTPITLDGTEQTSTGDLNDVTVVDGRGTLEGWSVTATLTDLNDGSAAPNHTIPATNMTWTPTCDAVDGNASEVTAGSTTTLHNTTAAALCTAAVGGGGGTYVADADLSLVVPSSIAAGTYTATLTLLLT